MRRVYPVLTIIPDPSNPAGTGNYFYAGYMPYVNKTSDGLIGAASTFIKTSLCPT